ncbi:hypothetical protein GCK72_019542 [Caenorhabditis remanei]|uniref:Uncharacterized protein n=1 Tax=Caenorhabditis remanei TaxID=31234 RepID=A0A6A5GCK8_CAERE|nr:hypothetical protein GCK72_019542 [Caenorhabditis remanei]KAF1752987.1 hypothetical protein GCK72_019542 [Caenorhabditis remanei]
MDTNTDFLTCLICGQVGQGKHFGVFSCRACAAFFRRAADSKWSRMKCLSKHCNGKSYHCKPCRLKRCYDMGMDITKFQHDCDGRQLIPSNRKRKIPDSIEIVLGKPHFLLMNPMGEELKEKKPYVDLSFLISQASDIFKMGPPAPVLATSYLQKLNYGESCMRRTENRRKLDMITRKEVVSFWEYNLITTAKWLTYFDKFQELDHDLKMQVLFAVWHVWGRLDKLMGTALYRIRNKEANKADRLAGNGIITDMVDVKTDAEWMSSYPIEKLRYFLDGVRISDLFPLIDELQTLDITETELSFMLAHLCFQYAANRLGGKLADILEGFVEVLSQDIHKYYVEEKLMPRYAGRLSKLLKINKEILENVREYRSRAQVARVFGVFKLKFSHPEIFRDTGYV